MSVIDPRKRWGIMSLIWLIGLAIFVLVAIPAHFAARHLGNPAIVTGYSLFAIIVLLGAFNVRKKVPVVPLFRANWWTAFHLTGGFLALALYVLHTGTLWPNGVYERVLALLFYLVSLSGLFGYVVERVYPPRLTGTGFEVIYERIPAELAEIRERAEALILACIKESRSDTVARYYVETFDWYFRRPRFLLGHLTGAQTAKVWLEREFHNSRNYLNESERRFLAELEALADTKSDIDFHYAVQRLLKCWLLVHVPAATGLMILALWHLLIVNIYIL